MADPLASFRISPAPAPAPGAGGSDPAAAFRLPGTSAPLAPSGAVSLAPEPEEKSSTLWPWLTAVGGTVGALALSRRPGAKEALGRIWTHGLSLPADLSTVWKRPQTAVLTELERLKSAPLEDVVHKIVENPKITALRAVDPGDIIAGEEAASAIFRLAGGLSPGEIAALRGPAQAAAVTRSAAARSAAASHMPRALLDVVEQREARLPLAQWAKAKLGLGHIPEEGFPYIARVADDTLDDVTTIGHKGGGLFGDLKTSLEGFQRSRHWPTLAQGMANGVAYHDPRFAIILREWRDIQLINTAKFVDNLERQGVLHHTDAAAKLASPTSQAFAVEGIPGLKRWWVPTKEEATLLKQNLESQGDSAFRRLVSLTNSYFRQPNLLNPYPHFTKNMLYKYALSGGDAKVFSRMAEWKTGSNPTMLAMFKQYLPFAEQPSTASAVVDKLLVQYSPSKGSVAEALRHITHLVGEKSNAWSSRKIFQELDPALRYARFAQYIEKGMPPQEAANHVILDLVRYGVRSDLVDFWKSIPFNMFVPWRLGTVTTVWKQMQSHPIKTALIIGAVDYLREARYRATGRWTHLPIDYVETPIARVVDEVQRGIDLDDPQKAAVNGTLALLGTAASTALFGPGGGFAASNLIDVFKTAQGKPEWDRLKNMFFLTASISELYDLLPRITRAFASGDPVAAARMAADVLAVVALAEHRATTYRPRRLMEIIPESWPGMRKSDEVRRAEEVQGHLRKAAEHAQIRRDRYRDLTIDKRLEKEGLRPYGPPRP